MPHDLDVCREWHTLTDPFQTALDFIWRPANDGQPFHDDDPDDPGGPTAWGVTYETWAFWRHTHNYPASLATFSLLARIEFVPFYRECVWAPCRCDDIPPAIALGLFDAAVMSGIGRSIRFLQSALGVPADGVFGPVTMAALNAIQELPDLVMRFCEVRGEFYDKLRGEVKYDAGWHRRAADCAKLALTLIPSTPLPASDADALNEAELSKMGDNE